MSALGRRLVAENVLSLLYVCVIVLCCELYSAVAVSCLQGVNFFHMFFAIDDLK